MKLLTFHGTIVRVDRATGARIHALPWPVRDCADDLEMDIPAEQPAAPLRLAGEDDLVLLPPPHGRGVMFRRNDRYLCADPALGEIGFDRQSGGIWETFLPMSAAEIEALRDIVSHGWTIEESGEAVPPGGASTQPGFELHVGAACIGLQAGVPALDAAGTGRVAVTTDGGILHLRRGEKLPGRDELALRRRAGTVAATDSEASFRAAPEGALLLRGDPEYSFLPLTARVADQNWMYAKFWRPGAPPVGPGEVGIRLVREREKYVLLTRWQEGVTFDEGGVSNEPGYLLNRKVTDRGLLEREGNTVFIDRAALAAAPRLAGSYAVFGNGNLSNYFHWTIDALLPLFIMRPHLPAGTRALLSATVRGLAGTAGLVDHLAAFAAWGFGDMELVEMPPPVCHVEEVFWLDHLETLNIPAPLLHAARAHVLSRLGPRRAGRRIYVRRRGSRAVSNGVEVERLVARHGFEVQEMESHDPTGQMEMFRDADWVIGPHGAGLTNIMFCAPGTRVVEISPDPQYRSSYAEISDKLGLVHAVLPGPTDNGSFYGNTHVDTGAMQALLRLLQHRL